MALIRRSDEKNFIIFSNSVSFGQGDPVPRPPRLQVFSSDFGNSHDPAGLGLGAGAPMPPVATLLRMRTIDGMDNGIATAPVV